MPGTGKYGTTYDKVAKKKPTLAKLFATDPQYDGSYTHDALIKLANQVLVPAHQAGDPTLFPAGVDLNFAGAPDFNDVTTSTKKPNQGWPMTPYTPNTMSPGADPAATGDNVATNVDPFKVGDPGLTPTDIKPNFVPDTDGVVEPDETATQIGSSVLDAKAEKLVPGKHPGAK